MYSEYSAYYANFDAQLVCPGAAVCPGWFLSQVDTFHECPAGCAKHTAHPESEFDYLFVVTVELLEGDAWAVYSSTRPKLAIEEARKIRDGGRSGVRLRRLVLTEDLETKVAFMIDKLEDWASD